MRVMMLPRSWRVLHVTESGQACPGAGKCHRRYLSIITRRPVLPVVRVATTVSVRSAATISLFASGATKAPLGTFESLSKVR